MTSSEYFEVMEDFAETVDDPNSSVKPLLKNETGIARRKKLLQPPNMQAFKTT